MSVYHERLAWSQGLFISHYVAQYQILAPSINTFYRPLSPQALFSPLWGWEGFNPLESVVAVTAATPGVFVFRDISHPHPSPFEVIGLFLS